MNRRMVRRITIWLILGLVILGCATPVMVTPPPSISEPGLVETVIVQTANAAQTQTAIVNPATHTPTLTPSPTKTATITPTPTATILFLFPTATSVPTNTLSSGLAGGTGSGNTGDGFVKPTAAPREWACRILSKSPANGAVLTGGSSFKAIWTVQNTGSKTWPKQGVDVVYASGVRLNSGKPYYDIPYGVSPGGTMTISVTMSIPTRQKDYSTRWTLKVGRTEFCSVRFAFEVK